MTTNQPDGETTQGAEKTQTIFIDAYQGDLLHGFISRKDGRPMSIEEIGQWRQSLMQLIDEQGYQYAPEPPMLAIGSHPIRASGTRKEAGNGG